MLDIILGAAGLLFTHSVIKGIKEDEEYYKKLEKEEEKRKSTPFSLPDPMTEEDFERIVDDCCYRLKRVQNWYVDLPYVRGDFLSQSGMTNWDFSIDFNNYGKLTTWYSAWSDNDDSNLPDRLAELIIDGVERFLQEYKDNSENASNEYVIYDSTEYAIGQPAIVPAISQEKAQMLYCPYCGNRIYVAEAIYCVVCGRKLRQ